MCYEEENRAYSQPVFGCKHDCGSSIPGSCSARISGGGQNVLTVKNSNYAATINLEDGGSLSLSKNSNVNEAWNTMAEELVPGKTMLWDGKTANAGFSKPTISSKEILTAAAGTYGVSGVQMEKEVEGVKSWFLFDNEILCAGAGVKAVGATDKKVIQVVDNIEVVKDTKLGLSNPWNGFRNVLTAYQAVPPQDKPGNTWASIVDTATKSTHTVRNYLYATSLPTSNLEWGYVFGNGTEYLNTLNVYYRFNTKGSGVPKLAEFWTQPGETWQYAMIPGHADKDDYYDNKKVTQTEAKILLNTKDIQAAADTDEGIVSVNKWTAGLTEVANSVVGLELNQPVSMTMKKDPTTGTILLTVSKPSQSTGDYIEIILKTEGSKILSNSNAEALAESNMGGEVYLKFDVAKMTEESVVLEIKGKEMETITGDNITLVRGEDGRIELDGTFVPEKVEVKIPTNNPDKPFVRNSGSNKIKRELVGDEVDGDRRAGDADGSHIASAALLSKGDIRVSAKEKGHVTIVATDGSGNQKQWNVAVLYADPAEINAGTPEDYAEIRRRWKESLVGIDLSAEGEEGQTMLEQINAEAKAAWENYDYKGQDSCPNAPWSEDVGNVNKENLNIPYENDAVEFRPAMKKVLAMAKAYAAKGSDYYQNADMLKDMTNALDYLCSVCYAPKSETDNWWTWEIGVPKDLVPALILIGDDLTQEQKDLYTEGLYFFQPDPFHGGAIGTGSTHAQAYRIQQAANRVDCTRTALGIGVLREDSDLVNLAQVASSEVFVVQEVEDSTAVAKTGYESGFYQDGSYLDHGRTPYTGSYGIEFLKGATEFPALLAGTPWEYPEEVRQNFEVYLREGLLNSMYDGRMLDFLKGRSVSRPAGSNKAAGRDAMTIMLKLMDILSEDAQTEIKSALKAWMEIDTEYIDSLVGVDNMVAKARAEEILNDASIDSTVNERVHTNYPLMDRVVHSTENYLFGISMYSERIQNTEIMNHENRYGWFQGNGMTYLYNDDIDHYSNNFWNTVNPMRLAGTTLVSKNIGNGTPDSSGYLQQGDFVSPESWVGGSSIGTNGINGMALSGKTVSSGDVSSPAIPYADNFIAKKSWFMFGDEILCLGAGITNSNDDHVVESIVENRHLSEEGDNTFTVNGEVMDLPVQEAKMTDIADGLVDVSGQKLTNVSWAHLEGNEETSGIGYYFPEKENEVSVRRAKNAGNWSDVGTFEGAAEENYLEMWFDHGKNPADASYSYVLLPGMNADETAQYASNPQITILANTDKVQAAYSESQKLMGANFWEKGSVGAVAVDKKSSVMTQEDENGVLTVAVSDPTMKNTGTIKVTINKPVDSIISNDENVTVDITADGAVLTVKTKGTNGGSSYASLQLAASISPEAVTAATGETVEFVVTGDMAADVAWSVKGTDASLAQETVIDESGVLTIALTEKNSALIVTATVNGDIKLTAFVSLGGTADIEKPEEIAKVETAINDVLKAAEEADDYTDEEFVKEIRSAYNLINRTPNDKLAQYLMDDVIAFEKVYRDVLSENGQETDTVIVVEEMPEIEPVEVSGEILNIPLKSTASNASSSNAVMKVSDATPSDAIWEQGNAAAIDENSIVAMKIQLELKNVKKNRSAQSLWAAPIQFVMNLPEELDAAKEILAVYTDTKGNSVKIPVTVDSVTGKMRFVLTGNGLVTFAQELDKIVADDTYYVKIDSSLTGGKVTANPVSGKKGTKITVTVKPDRGYKLEALYVNGSQVSVDKNMQYIFNLTRDTEITAEFEKSKGGFSGGGTRAGIHSVKGPVWLKDSDGWKLRKEDRTYAINEWESMNGLWYHFDQKGYRQTGWLMDEGKWYYLREDGAMAIGWICLDEKWYYLSPSSSEAQPYGSLYVNTTTPDNYKVNESGVWVQ